MWQDFLLVHRPSKQALPTTENSVLWGTCLRQLLFLLPQDLAEIEPSLDDNDQILRGQAAYQLCLEICSGLHSPIMGETEVFGQFRDFFLKLPNTSPFSRFLRSFAEQVITDTKQVRQEHLLNLGAQSYGSLLRRICGPVQSVCLIGAGQLSEEILPWFQGKSELHLVCRRMEQGQELTKQFSNLRIYDFQSVLPKTDVVLLAAPIPSETFAAWFSGQATPQILVDLRGEASVDPLHFSNQDNIRFFSLTDLFQSMERQRETQDGRAAQARERIVKLAAKQDERLRSKAEHRPFGWEDVCA